METLTGVLVDVSGSMERSVGDTQNHKGGEWARSIFNVVNDLIKHDVSSRNHIFALGFGACYKPFSFDLLSTIENSKVQSVSAGMTHQETLDSILSLLENNGAPRVRRWGKMQVLLSVVGETDAKIFLDRLSFDERFRSRFVNECLPESCRHIKIGVSSLFNETVFSSTNVLAWIGETQLVKERTGWEADRAVENFQGHATEDSVKDAVEKGKQLLAELTFKSIGLDSVLDVHKAQNILHGSVKQEELTNERVDELMEIVRPYIYGGTPLIKTLNAAKQLFSSPKFKDYNKLLFVLSDGKSNDGNYAPTEELHALGVKTVCCYITSDSIKDPRRLYSQEEALWDTAGKFMFGMSSTITTQLIPRTIFVKRGWKIDIENNETRLFAQVNHPNIIEDVCNLARNVVCCQDTLSDLLSKVSLDLYIDDKNRKFEPQLQVRGTCYAHASATVLHLSMQKIVGREGGCPDFHSLKDEIIQKYGIRGRKTLEVLEEVCPQYRLHCKKLKNTREALEAVVAKRPTVAKFQLTKNEWDIFYSFYRENPRGILTKSELNIRRPAGGLIGHAVVLTSFDSYGLRLMNSWSSDWADGGFFRVSSADVLGLEFIDVSWTTSDLKQSEIDAYKTHGASIADKLFKRLKGLQTTQYECPLCHISSELVEFTGHSMESTCPKCRKNFRITNPGDDLALNLYLLSLSRPK